VNAEFIELLNGIEEEKGIPKEVILEKLEKALQAAIRKHLGVNHSAVAKVDPETGEMTVYTHREIVPDRPPFDENTPDEDRGEPIDWQTQIPISQAKELDKKAKVGGFVDVYADPADFGRIAAQTARQVVMQGLREVERGMIVDQYEQLKGTILTGRVTRSERGNTMIEIGNQEAILQRNESIPHEAFKQGELIKVFLVDVSNTKNGAQLYISRTNIGFIKELFKREVPEIADATVEIKSIAREAGARTKIAVITNDENVDPRGACIGNAGSRVKAISNELNEEKIDVIRYSDNIEEFVTESLSPATITNVIKNEAEKVCPVAVPDDQLSLAIGKEGQNARLAARLTGWKIDIKSESYIAEL
jgi:N utilization substance protein A